MRNKYKIVLRWSDSIWKPYFNIVASNGQVIATSQVYSSLRSMMRTVRNLAAETCMGIVDKRR